MEKIKAVKKGLVTVMNGVMAAIVFVIVVINIVQVITRYFISVTFTWSEDITLLGLLWMACIGVPMIWMTDGHLRVDLFSRILPKPVLQLNDWVIEVFGLATGAGLLWAGNIARTVNRGFVMSVIGFDESFRYIPLLFCGVGLIVATVLNLIEKLLSIKAAKGGEIE